MTSLERSGVTAQHRDMWPELVWPGKVPLAIPSGASLVTVEIAGAERDAAVPPVGGQGWCNRLIWGDNLRAMAALLPEYAGQVGLIYVDPPFDTGTSYVQALTIQGEAGRRRPHVLREVAYRDVSGSGRAGYLQMLYERLQLMHALLADGGAIYVHVDPTIGPYVRLILDEIFGPTGFQREIVWRIGWVSGYKSAAANWVRNHDAILYYTKGRPAVFNKEYLAHPVGYRRRKGTSRAGRGYPVEDVWNASAAEQALTGAHSLDSIQIKSFSTEKTGFPTQKNESLLRRIVRASSNAGGLVADFFCGSGTTLAVADQLGRRWIGCDAGWRAIHTTRKRLLAVPSAAPFQVECSADPTADADESARTPARGAGSAARLELDVQISWRTVRVAIQGYHPAAQERAGAGPSGLRGVECLDYWAVDFDHDGALFRDVWRTFRGRGQGALALCGAAHTYAAGGTHPVAVKSVDVFGQQAMVVVEIALA